MTHSCMHCKLIVWPTWYSGPKAFLSLAFGQLPVTVLITVPLCFCSSSISIDSAYWVVKFDFHLRSGLLHGLSTNKCFKSYLVSLKFPENWTSSTSMVTITALRHRYKQTQQCVQCQSTNNYLIWFYLTCRYTYDFL